MLIIARVFVLLALAATAYSLVAAAGPHDSIYQMVIGRQVAAAQGIAPYAMSAPEAACAMDYTNSTQTIENRTITQTNMCIENANKNSTNNNTNVNKTVNSLRMHLTNVQKQLTVCLNLTDYNSIINCTTSSFNYNVYNLDQANILAYQAQDQILIGRGQVAQMEQNCVMAVTSSSNANLTVATNDYRKCLMSAKSFRGVALV